jgi:hypothetical protein
VPTVTSSIKDGDTVNRGSTWSLSVSPTPQRVEFWADGSKLADMTAGPFATPVNLPAGAHKLGVAVTSGGVRTTYGTGGVLASITVVDPPPPPALTFTSSVNTGDTVTRGTKWTVTLSESVDRVELWADGSRLADLTAGPYTTSLDLAAGTHKLGLAVTKGGVRKVFGDNGVIASITVVDPPPPPALTFTSSLQDGATVVRGTKWTVTLSQSVDRVELFADGARIGDFTSGPYTTSLYLSAGTHKLGLAVTKGGVRTVFGTNGVIATITVTKKRR